MIGAPGPSVDAGVAAHAAAHATLRAADGRGRSCVLGLLLLMSLVLGCGGDAVVERREGEATIETFLGDLTTGRYADAASELRMADGKALDDATRAELVAWWSSHLGRTGEIRISGFEYLSEEALTPAVLRALGADAGFQLVFNTRGSSTDPCWRVPVQNAVGRVAKIEGRWYVVENPINYLFPCPGGAVRPGTRARGSSSRWSTKPSGNRAALRRTASFNRVVATP